MLNVHGNGEGETTVTEYCSWLCYYSYTDKETAINDDTVGDYFLLHFLVQVWKLPVRMQGLPLVEMQLLCTTQLSILQIFKLEKQFVVPKMLILTRVIRIKHCTRFMKQ